MAEKTSAERWHDVIMLVLGFVLTTVVGGSLTHIYELSQEHQRVNEQRRAEATKLFEDLSRLMDTRIYKWRQVAWAVEDGKSASEIWKKYDDYQQILFEWSSSVNRNRALLCRYFGPDAGTAFETKIMPGFRNIQETLRKRLETNAVSRKVTFSREALAYCADPLSHLIYQLNNRLAESIRSGDVGSSDPGNKCDIEMELLLDKTHSPAPSAGAALQVPAEPQRSPRGSQSGQ
jgi:hypothetical protein